MTGTKCRGKCDIPGYDFVKSSSYQDGKLNYCSICIAYVKSQSKCPCCKLKLRTKSKARKDKRSKEGDEAFTLFDIAVIRVNNEFKILRKCYKIPLLGTYIIDSILRQFDQIIYQYERLEQEKRQRPDYLNAKIRKMNNLMDKVRIEVSIFNENKVYS